MAAASNFLVGKSDFKIRSISNIPNGPRLFKVKGNCSASEQYSGNYDFDSKKKSYMVQNVKAYAPCMLHGSEEQQQNGRDFNYTLGGGDRHFPERIMVAVDLDEVLGNFISAINQFIAERYSLNHSISEYHVYEFFKIWNCSRPEADIRVYEFFETSHFKKGIHPIPGALKALQKISKFCNLSIVTSRQNAIKEDTIAWIEEHYPGLFQEIHFGNHFALDGPARPKSDICKSLGAKVLIDDNPRYAIDCADAGIRVLLFDYENSYPWCKKQSVNKQPLITKVNNWEEVQHFVSHIFPREDSQVMDRP